MNTSPQGSGAGASPAQFQQAGMTLPQAQARVRLSANEYRDKYPNDLAPN